MFNKCRLYEKIDYRVLNILSCWWCNLYNYIRYIIIIKVIKGG